MTEQRGLAVILVGLAIVLRECLNELPTYRRRQVEDHPPSRLCIRRNALQIPFVSQRLTRSALNPRVNRFGEKRSETEVLVRFTA
jgi:hypothetical protein